MDGVILSVRTTLLMAFRSLPLILISFIGFLAAGLGNLGLFILFIGQALFLPILIAIVHLIVKRAVPTNNNMFYVDNSEKAVLLPGSVITEPRLVVAPSYWLAHIWSLLTYIYTNASAIKNLPKDPKIDPILVSNRISKANMVIISTIFIALTLTLLKFRTHTETLPGIGVAIAMGTIFGYAWYNFAASCGARAADVFGIVQQVIPSSAKDEKPMTCVYAPKP